MKNLTLALLMLAASAGASFAGSYGKDYRNCNAFEQIDSRFLHGKYLCNGAGNDDVGRASAHQNNGGNGGGNGGGDTGGDTGGGYGGDAKSY
jgi:hypothetical protein